MRAVKARLTYADYVALPDDGQRHEILAGKIAVTPAPGRRHQEVVGELFAVLHGHAKARRLGQVFVSPFDVILDDTSIVQPDIVYVVSGRLGIVVERGVEGAPSLVVEVISPSTRQRDRSAKLDLYARHGVAHCWVVDPEARSIEAYVLQSGAYVLQARASGHDSLRAEPFPDLAIPASTLWA
jgi:Uma2 family endonuclease